MTISIWPFYSGVMREEGSKQGVSIIIHRQLQKVYNIIGFINEIMLRLDMTVHGYRVSSFGTLPWQGRQKK